MLVQLSYQAYWELVITWVNDNPVDSGYIVDFHPQFKRNFIDLMLELLLHTPEIPDSRKKEPWNFLLVYDSKKNSLGPFTFRSRLHLVHKWWLVSHYFVPLIISIPRFIFEQELFLIWHALMTLCISST